MAEISSLAISVGMWPFNMAGWTFNAAGLHSTTVEKYGGSLLGEADNIQAYRVEGELLTKIQEVNLAEDYKMLKGHIDVAFQHFIVFRQINFLDFCQQFTFNTISLNIIRLTQQASTVFFNSG